MVLFSSPIFFIIFNINQQGTNWLELNHTAKWIWDSSIFSSIKPKLDMGLFVDFCVFTCFYQCLHDVLIKLFCFDPKLYATESNIFSCNGIQFSKVFNLIVGFDHIISEKWSGIREFKQKLCWYLDGPKLRGFWCQDSNKLCFPKK